VIQRDQLLRHLLAAETILSDIGNPMCIADAYLICQGKTELIMENVERIQVIETNVWSLSGLFGEEKRIVARMNSIELIENQILFEEI
jgi:predicted RNA-binding protein